MNENNIPLAQEIEAHKLEAEGVRDLFKLQLADSVTVLYLTDKETLVWGDQTWEQWPNSFTGASQNSSGEKSRPKFTIANPEGIFSSWCEQGVIDGSVLTRYRVSKSDIESGVRNYAKNVWTISRVLNVNKNIASMECRSLLDGQSFILPSRAFYPPDFPHVSLQ